MSEKTIAIVHGTVSDLYNSNDPDDYCINVLKKSDLLREKEVLK